MNRIVLLTCVALCSAGRAGAQGTCVTTRDVRTGVEWRSDPRVCGVRISPASTFKIPHALIALTTGATSETAVETWDGTRFPGQTSWEHDHTLTSALQNSVVWFFQRTAVRIGADRMHQILTRLGYGNADTSGIPTMYWLNGVLRISPDEQLDFLARLFADTLPFDAARVEFVKIALRQEPGTIRNSLGIHKMGRPWKSSTQLVAKTGATTMQDGTGVSWLVGLVVRGDQRVVFASAVARPGRVDPTAASTIGLETLRARGVLD